MKSDSTLTPVQQRLLAEILAYHDEMGRHIIATGSIDKPRGGDRARQGWAAWLDRGLKAGLVVAFVAFATVLVVQLASRIGASALAATPAPLTYRLDPARSGRTVLLQLAGVAARRAGSAAPTRTDAYAYVESAGWSLGTRVNGSTSSSSVVPTITQSWIKSDGSGRVLRTSARSLRTRIISVNRPFRDSFTLRAGDPLKTLSANPTVVARQLAVGHPTRIGPVERFIAFTDLSLAQPLPSDVESAILRVLARSPGLVYRGTVVDRAGRSGVAVSLDSAYSGLLTRYTLILDTGTGQLLGEEETLIGAPRKLDVRTGAVLSYTVFLQSRYVRGMADTQ